MKWLRNNYVFEGFFGRILSPFEIFMKSTTAGGVFLIACAVASLILANTPAGSYISAFWHAPVRIGTPGHYLEMSIHAWVNDGLMTLFFLLVGLELKRELLAGELSSVKDASLPVFAALGGMIVPALIYWCSNPSGLAARGWGIPMATDIAFAVGVMALLARRIPAGLMVFLTALAIADDLGAVLVIALFYTSELSLTALGSGLAILVLLFVLNRGRVLHPAPYIVLGFLLWLALLKSGVHPTIAGVLLAFCIPASSGFTPSAFASRIEQLRRALADNGPESRSCLRALECPQMAAVAENFEHASRIVQSPLQRMEHSLSPWVTFLVLPVFAFSNLDIDFSKVEPGALSSSITLGVAMGLVPGKMIGITLFSWIAVKTGLGRLPNSSNFLQISGVGWLAGIGFTMALFVTNLAFSQPESIEQAKLGILGASTLAAALGLSWLWVSTSHAAEVSPDSGSGTALDPARPVSQ